MSKVECKLCGREFHLLSRHLAMTHHITKDDYLKMYPGAELVSSEYHDSRSTMAKEQWKNNTEYREIMKNAVIQSNKLHHQEIQARMHRLNQRMKEDKEFSNYCSQRRSEGQKKSWTKKWVRESRITGMKFSFLKPGYHNPQWDKIRGLNGQMYKVGELYGIHYKSSYEKFFIQFLVDHKINFEYEPTYFYYKKLSDNRIHKYYPDFYLTDYDLYIEIHPKNLLSDEFLNKISVVNNLLLLTENELFSDDLYTTITDYRIDDQHPSHST